MKKFLAVFGITVLFVGTVLVLKGFSGEAAKAPDEIKLCVGKKKGEVTLKHKDHAEKYGNKCVDCHHEYKEDAKEVKKCSACHDPKEVKEKAPKLKDAYHNNCWKGCHKKVSAEKKKAPVKCNGCHIKKK